MSAAHNLTSSSENPCCSVCGTEPFADCCPECMAEVQTIARVEDMSVPPSIYDDEFWAGEWKSRLSDRMNGRT